MPDKVKELEAVWKKQTDASFDLARKDLPGK
jgi:hypothetical protein